MGSFVESSLISGEKVESSASISWLSQFWYLFFAAFFALGAINTHGMFLLCLFFFVLAVINVTTTELAVTNKKVIGKAGFIRRTSIDMPLEKLESININQGILGRILGYGRVSVRGIGGNVVSIPYIKTPLQFRRVVMDLMDKKTNSRI
ncbi:PH domain-containing protein [Ralstonia solanacearum]|nr:PH domain-containing protein [Ralstonia solanacearum]